MQRVCLFHGQFEKQATLAVCCCAEANMYRQHLCRRKIEPLTWIHILINVDSQTDTRVNTQTHTCMYTMHAWVLSPQTKSTQHLFFFPKDSLSLSHFPQTFYLLGGWALKLGLILSCRLEPVPWGQLSANTQQPLFTYPNQAYTLLHYIHIHNHITDTHSTKYQTSVLTILNKDKS